MEIILIIFALSLSAFNSGTETVFLSVGKIRLEVQFRKGKKGSDLVKKLIAKPESFIITTLLGNNISNVLYASIFAIYYDSHFNDFTGIIISSLIVLVIGEIIPKAIGWEFAHLLIFKVAYPLRFFYVILFPIIWLLNVISSFILSIFNVDNNGKGVYYLTKKDMEMFIQESEKAGIVDKDEGRIIYNLLDLEKTKVKETMVPRTEIVALKKNASIQTAFRTFCKSGYSRLPVYDRNIDNIIGVVHAKDLFNQPQNLKDIINSIQAVPGTKSVFRLLQEFRSTQTSMAVVLDEYGGTAGLVTFEDLVEELFGEIYDEFDLDNEHLLRKLNAFTYVMDARAEIDELNAKLKLNIPEGNYTTIAGFIINALGKIPIKGEYIILPSCKIIITKTDPSKVIEAKIIIKR